MRKLLCVILTLIFAFTAFFAGYQIIREYRERRISANVYTDLDKYVKTPEVTFETDENESDSSESEETQIPNNIPEIDFDALFAINPDCVGWIYIPDTEISYPIVQGSDNSYYLKHLFDGKWNSSGCIFLDYRVDDSLSDRHSIIYGHHMKNGTMFSGLSKYKKQDYYETHPVGYIITPEQTYRIEFFAGYVAGVTDPAWKIDFESDEVFEEWINEAKKKSWFESNLSPAVTDKVLTLSTCSYEFDNARFVLLGVLK